MYSNSKENHGFLSRVKKFFIHTICRSKSRSKSGINIQTNGNRNGVYVENPDNEIIKEMLAIERADQELLRQDREIILKLMEKK